MWSFTIHFNDHYITFCETISLQWFRVISKGIKNSPVLVKSTFILIINKDCTVSPLGRLGSVQECKRYKSWSNLSGGCL